jgi:GntR family transcriptional repressor for pyruvate dehydrogenase complex
MEFRNRSISRIEKAPKIPTLVAKQIVDLISDGSLKPGDKLPSEQKMTKLFGISRISLREAMKLLEAKGYIQSLDRRGKFIMLPDENTKSPIEGLIAVDPEKIWDLLNVRRFLDSEAAFCACKRATKDDLAALKKVCDKAVNLGVDDILHNIKEGGKLYTEFFDLISQLTRNSVFIYLRKSINTILLDAFPYSRKKLSLIEGSSRMIMEHLFSIHDALENKDPEAAKQGVIAHIDYIEKSLKKALARGES